MMIRWFKKNIKHFVLQRRFPKSKIYYGASVDSKSSLGINSVVFPGTVLIHSEIGDYTYVQKNSALTQAHIGRFCSLASDVHIGLANHPLDRISTSPVFYDPAQPLPSFLTDQEFTGTVIPQTVIEADVWIGQGAMIKAGIRVGVGAVVGAGAVVTKDVGAYSIVAGIPAKHIGYRFDADLRQSLLALEWWERDDECLKNLEPYFATPKEFVEKMKETLS